MPEKKIDVAGFELQSLLGSTDRASAAAAATAMVSMGCSCHRGDMQLLQAPCSLRLLDFDRTNTLLQVSVTGMHCSSCSTAVERALR